MDAHLGSAAARDAASARNFACETDLGGDRPVVTVAGEVDIATADVVRDALCAALDGSGPVVADLSRVEFIDSSGVHAVLVADIAARDRGSALILRAPHPSVVRLFALLGLTEQLTFESGPT